MINIHIFDGNRIIDHDSKETEDLIKKLESDPDFQKLAFDRLQKDVRVAMSTNEELMRFISINPIAHMEYKRYCVAQKKLDNYLPEIELKTK